MLCAEISGSIVEPYLVADDLVVTDNVTAVHDRAALLLEVHNGGQIVDKDVVCRKCESVGNAPIELANDLVAVCDRGICSG